ncbi:hypothetical protein AAMO2058_001322400 [Amorphochlora amoebiformis]
MESRVYCLHAPGMLLGAIALYLLVAGVEGDENLAPLAAFITRGVLFLCISATNLMLLYDVWESRRWGQCYWYGGCVIYGVLCCIERVVSVFTPGRIFIIICASLLFATMLTLPSYFLSRDTSLRLRSVPLPLPLSFSALFLFSIATYLTIDHPTPTQSHLAPVIFHTLALLLAIASLITLYYPISPNPNPNPNPNPDELSPVSKLARRHIGVVLGMIVPLATMEAVTRFVMFLRELRGYHVMVGFVVVVGGVWVGLRVMVEAIRMGGRGGEGGWMGWVVFVLVAFQEFVICMLMLDANPLSSQASFVALLITHNATNALVESGVLFEFWHIYLGSDNSPFRLARLMGSCHVYISAKMLLNPLMSLSSFCMIAIEIAIGPWKGRSILTDYSKTTKTKKEAFGLLVGYFVTLFVGLGVQTIASHLLEQRLKRIKQAVLDDDNPPQDPSETEPLSHDVGHVDADLIANRDIELDIIIPTLGDVKGAASKIPPSSSGATSLTRPAPLVVPGFPVFGTREDGPGVREGVSVFEDRRVPRYLLVVGACVAVRYGLLPVTNVKY